MSNRSVTFLSQVITSMRTLPTNLQTLKLPSLPRTSPPLPGAASTFTLLRSGIWTPEPSRWSSDRRAGQRRWSGHPSWAVYISGTWPRRQYHQLSQERYIYLAINDNVFKTPGLLKGQVAWISEKQRLPVKTFAKASFYGEKLHCGRLYEWRERNYVIYVYIDVNLDGNGWVCCCSTFNSQKRSWWCSCLKWRPPCPLNRRSYVQAVIEARACNM